MKKIIITFTIALSLIGFNDFNLNTHEAEASASYGSSNYMRDLALKVAKGKRYVYGASNRYAVDCSGFAQQFMKARGKYIPRTTYSQMAYGKRVYKPKAGDLVFFNGGSHVGVYIGNGKMVDALNPRYGVGERRVSWVNGYVSGYYRY